ncbi:heparan-alpha-glucosaminide N-acetyltransferase-like isoform X2 [Leptopilina boulardi]|uniref:heparan-alpha-glucosaminide N-acetyltransferase-like isoform X2 n=1 Tax=Leptopilina boulardi TaxID=63433 RepID=UPI0021F530BC|nr:heparan-alpha-glucosaminide N-acetyltransferase-like isoform X2 [Leptopilina boulardi]
MLTLINNDKDNPCLNKNLSLGIDQACFSVINDTPGNLTLYSVINDCYVVNCEGLKWATLLPHSNTTLVTEAKLPLHIFFKDSKKGYEWCHDTFNFRQYGHYGWNITDENGGCSSIYTMYTSWNPYLPILAALMMFVLVATIFTTSKMIIRTVKLFRQRENGIDNDHERLQESDASPGLISISKTSSRMKSVDAFRGIAILLMIFVNNGGGKYYFFEHSPWNGLTVADLVLPWFAWIMGFMIVKSIRVSLQLSISRKRILFKLMRRSLILILLGLMVNSYAQTKYTLWNLRFPGILQLLAITFFICAAIETIFLKPQRSFQYGRLVFLSDIFDSWPQWLIVTALTTLHTLMIFLLHVPGCPDGYFGPGGCHRRGKYVNCTGGAVGYIDREIFGNHLYNKTENPLYRHTLPHDPEGLMNTLSAVLIVYLGVHAGRIFFTYYQCTAKMIRWLVWSVVTGLIAGLLCNFEKENGVIPINKNMMSLSYVLATSSFAFLLFTILHLLIDYKKYWTGAPFIYAGANPILLYVGHYLTKGLFPFAWDIMGTPTHTFALLMNLWTTVLWGFIAYLLYRKDIIISI